MARKPMVSTSWVKRTHGRNEIHSYAVKCHVLSKQTQYQHIELLETFDYGLMLLLDGYIQSTQVDEFIYHEAIVHPALCAHPNPNNILVIGGGEGATLREVLRHSTVERAVMVDIDRELVDTSREYLSAWHQGAFDDPRVTLIYDDGRA